MHADLEFDLFHHKCVVGTRENTNITWRLDKILAWCDSAWRLATTSHTIVTPELISSKTSSRHATTFVRPKLSYPASWSATSKHCKWRSHTLDFLHSQRVYRILAALWHSWHLIEWQFSKTRIYEIPQRPLKKRREDADITNKRSAKISGYVIL